MSFEPEGALQRINLVLATSGMLLFSNRERAASGFVASLFTIVVASLSSITFD